MRETSLTNIAISYMDEVGDYLRWGEDVAHAILLRLHVEGVMLIGLGSPEEASRRLRGRSLRGDALDGVVGEQAHLLDAELLEDLSADAVVTFVSLVTEVEVRFDGV